MTTSRSNYVIQLPSHIPPGTYVIQPYSNTPIAHSPIKLIDKFKNNQVMRSDSIARDTLTTGLLSATGVLVYFRGAEIWNTLKSCLDIICIAAAAYAILSDYGSTSKHPDPSKAEKPPSDPPPPGGGGQGPQPPPPPGPPPKPSSSRWYWLSNAAGIGLTLLAVAVLARNIATAQPSAAFPALPADPITPNPIAPTTATTLVTLPPAAPTAATNQPLALATLAVPVTEPPQIPTIINPTPMNRMHQAATRFLYQESQWIAAVIGALLQLSSRKHIH